MKLNNQIAEVLIDILLTFLGSLQIQALVTFKPGLRAGVNFSHFSKGIIPVYYSDINHANVVFSIDGTYTFDVKLKQCF